ncbi:MAG: division/cell wall cluster transcriptional repressor MraZ [Chloroflexi bacterium]|nr:division/cell wall cluster transcriptional repressor MraZ [Chloroflexota bacterium]
MQFHGEFQHRVDPQGRIAIPARYREAFTGGIYLTRGFDQCVWVFSPEEWGTYSSRYAAMSPNSRVARTLRRRVFGSTFDLELDRQGRVVLPQPLRQFAGLQDEVVIVGAGTWLELWDRSRWDEQVAEIDAADLDFVEDGGRVTE